jgi:hypothetical protein
MKINWMSKRLPMAAAVLFLCGAQVAKAQTNEAPKMKPADGKAQSDPGEEKWRIYDKFFY